MGIRRCFSLLPATASQNFHALRTRFPPHPIRVATTSSHSAKKAHSTAGLPHIILVYLCKNARDGMNKYSRQLENTRVFSSDSPCGRKFSSSERVAHRIDCQPLAFSGNSTASVPRCEKARSSSR